MFTGFICISEYFFQHMSAVLIVSLPCKHLNTITGWDKDYPFLALNLYMNADLVGLDCKMFGRI